MTNVYVYILGAGASKPDGVPVTKEIFSAAFHNTKGQRNDGTYRLHGFHPFSKDEAKRSWPPLFKLFDACYGTHLERDLVDLYNTKNTPPPFKVNTQQFEHFYTNLYYMNKGQQVYGHKLAKAEIGEIWRKAKHLFYHTIGTAGWGKGGHRHYQAFVQKALGRPGIHCVISFNNDTLLDDRLSECCKFLDPKTGKFVRRQDLDWTYGIVAEQTEWPQPHYYLAEEAKISYYKLHGSLNWRFDQRTQKVSLCHPTMVCNCPNSPQEEDERLVIPPIKKKNFPSTLKKIWKEASDKLSKAEELCVIGYSAPDVDEEALALLRKIPRSLKRVAIVNLREDHRQRILSLLGNPSEKIVTPYVGFKEYLDEELGASLDRKHGKTFVH